MTPILLEIIIQLKTLWINYQFPFYNEMSHTGIIHIMHLEMLMAPEVLILPCSWILIKRVFPSGPWIYPVLWSATQRCQTGKWNSFLMRCESEVFFPNMFSFIIKKIKFPFSPPVFVFEVNSRPNVRFELTIPRSRVPSSTNWASLAPLFYYFSFI